MGEALFQYEYMRYAFACGAIIGVLCAIIGVYVILRGMSFLGVGISHSAIGGTAIGVAAGISTELSAFVYCMITVWLIGLLSSENRMKLDAAIGVLFAFSQALGIFIFSLTPTLRSDLNSYLFGSIVSVDMHQLVLSACALVIIGAVLICVYRPLNSMIFDAEFAQVCGVRVTLLHYLLLLLTAVCVVCSMQ
ncbi:MAG: metal ABC transporter permease, partial [Abditibacteriota bacterium]|nr:metal ABC transporter permease [Abditibacteriota bacterium]